MSHNNARPPPPPPPARPHRTSSTSNEDRLGYRDRTIADPRLREIYKEADRRAIERRRDYLESLKRPGPNMLDDPRIAEIYRQTDIRAREKRREYIESWKRGEVSENDARAEREAATAGKEDERRAQEARRQEEDEGREKRREEWLRRRRERGDARGERGPHPARWTLVCIARVAILLKSVQLADILPLAFIGTLPSHFITTTTGLIPNMESFLPAAPQITLLCLSTTLSPTLLSPSHHYLPIHKYVSAPHDVDLIFIGGPTLMRTMPSDSLTYYLREAAAQSPETVIMKTCISARWAAEAGLLEGN